jgi:hypothetical protein
MTNIPSETAAPQTPVIPDAEAHASLWARLGSGLFLFSLLFSTILGASYFYVLPRLTAVKLQGKTVDLSVIMPYEQKLRAQLEDAESKRNRIVLPVNDAQFEFLKQSAQCYPLLEDMSAQIAKAADAIGDKAVVFSGFAFDAKGTLSLAGDVRNVGPRSMTLLAQLVESLEALPFVSSAVPPAFTREKDAVIGFHSPFSFSLTLKASDNCPSTQR